MLGFLSVATIMVQYRTYVYGFSVRTPSRVQLDGLLHVREPIRHMAPLAVKCSRKFIGECLFVKKPVQLGFEDSAIVKGLGDVDLAVGVGAFR